ncbi:hypothetical protein ACA910_014854 [Epithemia clementina (nom. ined.)]
MTPEFKDLWIPFLLPVLDEFLESYKGSVHHGFWQSMVKLRHTGGGSGSYSFISGWVQILFPYLASWEINQNLRPWNEMYFRGPELSQFHAILSTAPVDWEYHDTTFDLTFHAGVIGFIQVQQNDNDVETTNCNAGALSPLIGWYVSHVPPKPLNIQLRDFQKELDDLLLGHKEEADAPDSDEKRNASWYQRMKYLEGRISAVEQKMSVSPGMKTETKSAGC